MFLQRLIKSNVLTIFLSFLIIGCGKELDTQIDEEVVSRQELKENSVILRSSLFTNGGIAKDTYNFNENALVLIPAAIEVEEGNAGNQWARIYFNEYLNEAEFFCDYKGGAFTQSPDNEWEIEKGKIYHFYGCYQDVDLDGTLDELNYYPGMESIQDRDHSISLDILGADPRFNNTSKTLIEIEWH